MKRRTIKMRTVELPTALQVNREVDIPLHEGDSMTLVLMMAVAKAEGTELVALSTDNTMRKMYEYL